MLCRMLIGTCTEVCSWIVAEGEEKEKVPKLGVARLLKQAGDLGK